MFIEVNRWQHCPQAIFAFICLSMIQQSEELDRSQTLLSFLLRMSTSKSAVTEAGYWRMFIEMYPRVQALLLIFVSESHKVETCE